MPYACNVSRNIDIQSACCSNSYIGFGPSAINKSENICKILQVSTYVPNEVVENNRFHLSVTFVRSIPKSQQTYPTKHLQSIEILAIVGGDQEIKR